MKIKNSAIKKIKILLSKKEFHKKKFCITIKNGGCSGYKYKFNIKKKNKDDIYLDKYQKYIITNRISYKFLKNSILYHKKNLDGEKFVIKNSSFKNSCGCGYSFFM